MATQAQKDQARREKKLAAKKPTRLQAVSVERDTLQEQLNSAELQYNESEQARERLRGEVNKLQDSLDQMAGELQQARAYPRKETVGAVSVDTRPITNHVASMPTINVNEGGVVNITNNNA